MSNFLSVVRAVTRSSLITLSLILVIEGGLQVAVEFKKNYIDLPRLIPDIYKNEQWAYTLAREKLKLHGMWWPYVYFRAKPFTGEMITISSNGLRKTWNSFDEPIKFRIFMFGGSTMNGALRDDYTIPSQLSRKIYNLGYRGVEVVNFGQGGYVNTQEMLTLLFEIRSQNIPHVAIFYDGINDVFSGIQQGRPGLAQNEQNRIEDFNASKSITSHQVLTFIKERQLYRLSQRISSMLFVRVAPAPDIDHDRVAKEVVNTYLFNRDIIELVSKKYGIQTWYYWQPTFFDKPQLSEYEKKSEKTYPFYVYPDIYQKSSQLISKTIAAKKIPNLKNISRVFNDTKHTIFLDTLHVSEEGDGMLADEILKNLQLPNALKSSPK